MLPSTISHLAMLHFDRDFTIVLIFLVATEGKVKYFVVYEFLGDLREFERYSLCFRCSLFGCIYYTQNGLFVPTQNAELRFFYRSKSRHDSVVVVARV